MSEDEDLIDKKIAFVVQRRGMVKGFFSQKEAKEFVALLRKETALGYLVNSEIRIYELSELKSE